MAEQVGVYLSEQKSTEEPAYFVDREEARSLKRANQAFFINHGRDIRLLAAQPKPLREDAEKSRWLALPSGMPQIGYVSVLQLLT